MLWIRGHRPIGWLSIAASWLTVVELLWFEHDLIHGSKLIGAVVLARNVVLMALLVVLVAARVPGAEPQVNGGNHLPSFGTRTQTARRALLRLRRHERSE